jgi:hypothetical protein
LLAQLAAESSFIWHSPFGVFEVPNVKIFILREYFMSFAIYLVGFAILIGGVAWGLIIAGVPELYVIITSVILLGIGILTGVSRTRGKDPS